MEGGVPFRRPSCLFRCLHKRLSGSAPRSREPEAGRCASSRRSTNSGSFGAPGPSLGATSKQCSSPLATRTRGALCSTTIRVACSSPRMPTCASRRSCTTRGSEQRLSTTTRVSCTSSLSRPSHASGSSFAVTSWTRFWRPQGPSRLGTVGTKIDPGSGTCSPRS